MSARRQRSGRQTHIENTQLGTVHLTEERIDAMRAVTAIPVATAGRAATSGDRCTLRFQVVVHAELGTHATTAHLELSLAESLQQVRQSAHQRQHRVEQLEQRVEHADQLRHSGVHLAVVGEVQQWKVVLGQEHRAGNSPAQQRRSAGLPKVHQQIAQQAQRGGQQNAQLGVAQLLGAEQAAGLAHHAKQALEQRPQRADQRQSPQIRERSSLIAVAQLIAAAQQGGGGIVLRGAGLRRAELRQERALAELAQTGTVLGQEVSLTVIRWGKETGALVFMR